MTTNQKYSNLIKTEAKRLGFDACGVAKAEYLGEEAGNLKSWLKNGMHGTMKYMENHFEKRVNPGKLVEGAKSIISVLLNYYPSQTQNPDAPKISKYAYGQDYHIIIRDKLFNLLEFINSKIKKVNGRVFVDSAPVFDRTWAAMAGLGWIGKNSCLINKDFGSFVFIGELIVDIELEYDEPFLDYCGDCTKCIEACPTNAIISPKIIDSRKCISYLTVEYKGEMPKKFKKHFKDWIFGCDICQDICPWNLKKTKPTKEKQFRPIPEIINYDKEHWNNLSEEKFKQIFKDSPLLRTGYKRLKRNLEYIS